MAGSLAHIVDKNGRFTMDLIENMGDAHEALEQCFQVIFSLSHGEKSQVNEACALNGFVKVRSSMKSIEDDDDDDDDDDDEDEDDDDDEDEDDDEGDDDET